MHTDKIIERKILDYFYGQLPAEEEAGLIQWIKLDEENKAYFLRMKESLDPNEMQHPLLQSSYSELKGKLLINQQFKAHVSDRVRQFQLSFSKIAAMLVIALVAGFAVAYLISNNFNQNKVVWFETQVPRGEKSQLILPDGSKVWVNSESSISYPSNFMDGNREIKLKGEAYFEVAKNQGRPFTVETNDYNIKVLGTKFNVMAYSNFGRTETSLLEGKIEIQRGEQSIPVVPGQTFTYSENKFSIQESKVNQTARWKDDIFDFDRVTLKELMIRLERWYDVEIDFKNPELNRIVYSGVFKNEETIWQVLETFQLTLPIRYERVGFRKFIIEKNVGYKK